MEGEGRGERQETARGTSDGDRQAWGVGTRGESSPGDALHR